jgi:hypothetical protein
MEEGRWCARWHGIGLLQLLAAARDGGQGRALASGRIFVAYLAAHSLLFDLRAASLSLCVSVAVSVSARPL